MVDDRLILELNSVEKVNDIHVAQHLRYMKLSRIDIGVLVNFNVKKLVDGIERFRL